MPEEYTPGPTYYVNGVEVTEAEWRRIQEMQAAVGEGERADADAYEAQEELTRPLTAEEALGALIRSVSILLAALPDSALARLPWAFLPWAPDVTYVRGALMSHGEHVWRSTRAHTSGSDAPPGTDGAPYEQLVDEWGGATVWVQPVAGHGYAAGARVIWAYRLWESEIDDNIYVPGVYGWRAV